MAGRGVTLVANKCEEAKTSGILNLRSCELVSVPAAVYFLVKDVNISQCSLAYNQLKSFPKKLPSKLPDLKGSVFHVHIHVLSLRGNKIEEVSEDISTLCSLQAIDLSENNIRCIDHKLFSPMKSLQILNLGGNRIESFPIEEFLSDLPNIKKLILTGNPLTRDTVDRLNKSPNVIFEDAEK